MHSTKLTLFGFGCSDLTIAVDYKPKLKVFGDRSLEDIFDSWLQKLREKPLYYQFYTPGVCHKAASLVFTDLKFSQMFASGFHQAMKLKS